MNKVMLIGNVGAEPEVRYVDQGVAVARLRLATSERGYTLPNGRHVYVLAEGRLVNLAAGDGHPAEIMDMSFSIQALALEYMKDHGRSLPPEVYEIPQSIDDTVSALKLRGIGMEIDRLTPEQEAYLAGWEL